MNYKRLQKLRNKLYFTIEDMASVLDIKTESSRVLASRYVKEGLFVRLKNNLYVLEQDWNAGRRDYFLKLSNYLQVPSYISFLTALSLYDVTTQVQRNFWESASLKRSCKFEVKGTVFNFYKLRKEHYFDFIKKEDVFIANKEKAFLDAVYLYSFGKYKIDFDSLDLDKLDRVRLERLLAAFPAKTQSIVRRLCRI